MCPVPSPLIDLVVLQFITLFTSDPEDTYLYRMESHGVMQDVKFRFLLKVLLVKVVSRLLPSESDKRSSFK